MILNEEFEWTDVRYLIGRQRDAASGRSMSYDVSLSFHGRAVKEQLPAGTTLYRLDFPVVLGIFMKSWWMKSGAFRRVFDAASGSSSALRQEWQNSLSLSKPVKGKEGKFGGRQGEASPRTQIVVIQIVQPVFGWVGSASPLFHKSGGEEQVYLPNLAHGAGPNGSNYARLLNTYTLPA